MRDFDSIVKDKEIPWVRHWIDATFEFSKNFIKPGTTNEIDFEALGKEEWEFRKALKTKDFTSSKRAEYLWNEAIKLRDRNRANGSKGGRPRKNPQDAPNGNAGEDHKLETSCDQFKADGDTREGSHDGKSGTSANIYATRQAKNGDAPHREAGDESATVSKPFALDSLTRQGQTTAKTRDSRGSGRYQPPSLGPEDGNLYDQETASGNYQVPEVSTDEKRTGGHSPLSRSPSSRPPVRDRRVSGDVLNLAYSGEFGNVRLTQEQYNELGIKFGNQQKLNRAIDSLSCQIENGEKTPKNHYAELVKWANYRDDMEEKEELKAATQPHFETVSEHNARIVRESDKWIDEYYSQKRKAANNGK